MIRRNQYVDQIIPFIDKDLIKVLTGIRRCGKSIMLELIKKEISSRGVEEENFISYNFESFEHSHLLDARALHDEVKSKCKDLKGTAYLFFDEIQEVEGWEKAINSLRVSVDCDIYVTGSNAKLLSSELATYLSGRYVEFTIYPFSFKEFTELYKEKHSESKVQEIFQEYISLGGMPYLSNLNFKSDPCKLYLQDLYNALVLKDVVKRNAIRDVDLLERILAYVLSNIGTTFSANNISKYFKNEGRKVSPETVLNYLNACEQAYLFHRVKREDLQGKKVLSINEKYYVSDLGLREAIIGSNEKDINLALENIVYMELLRRGYKVTVGKFNDKEVDFVARKWDTKIYVQVSYILGSDETIEREFSVLESIPDNYPKYVLSMDSLNMSRNGIIHNNIVEFLMNE